MSRPNQTRAPLAVVAVVLRDRLGSSADPPKTERRERNPVSDVRSQREGKMSEATLAWPIAEARWPDRRIVLSCRKGASKSGDWLAGGAQRSRIGLDRGSVPYWNRSNGRSVSSLEESWMGGGGNAASLSKKI